MSKIEEAKEEFKRLIDQTEKDTIHFLLENFEWEKQIRFLINQKQMKVDYNSYVVRDIKNGLDIL